MLLTLAFYYSTLSQTNRYSEMLRGGDFVDHYPVAELLGRSCAEDERVETFHVSILHYLSRCTTVPLPIGDDRKHPDAAVVMAFLGDHPDVAFVVIAKLQRTGSQCVYRGKTLQVSRRNAGGHADGP